VTPVLASRRVNRELARRASWQEWRVVYAGSWSGSIMLKLRISKTPMIIFENANLLDGTSPELRKGFHVAVEDGRIVEITDASITSSGAQRIDVGGRTLMPGLIDAHAHMTLIDTNLSNLRAIPQTLLTARAGVRMKKMLMRGFTTVRDTGGADWGLRQAVEEGSLIGPRLFISARPITQRGGHGDNYLRTEAPSICSCSSALDLMSTIADGKELVQAAAREQQRQGADQIKVFVSGGVASRNDPLYSVQFSAEELIAIVDEAERWGIYVCAHAYSARAILHALNAGVRTIEHGNFIDNAGATLMASKDAYLVPTLITYEAMHRHAATTGLSKESLEKLEQVRSSGLQSIAVCRQAGAKLGFGTDLLGDLADYQSEEFLIRSAVESPFEIIKSATLINAEIVRQDGRLGVLAVGAIADMLVVAGNPLKDLGLLQDQGAHIPVIMKGGELFKNELL
jgi:imidazolonepropionase-like amidohydrolase